MSKGTKVMDLSEVIKEFGGPEVWDFKKTIRRSISARIPQGAGSPLLQASEHDRDARPRPNDATLE